MGDAGPQYFSYAYLFCLLHGHEGDHSIESQAADEDGNAGEYFDEGKDDHFRLIEFGDAVVQNLVAVAELGMGFIPFFFKGCQSPADPAHVELDGAEGIIGILGGYADGGYPIPEGVVMKILYHSHADAFGGASVDGHFL